MKNLLKFGRQYLTRYFLCNTVYKQNTTGKWTKSYILSFPKKGKLKITKKYRGLNLTAIDWVYNAPLLRCIWSETEKIPWKNQNCFWKNLSNYWRSMSKLIFIDFSKVFNSRQSKNEANTICIWSFQRNCFHYNLQKQWFVHLMETQTSSSLLQESCKEIYLHHICLYSA